jgi:hypothetical protein
MEGWRGGGEGRRKERNSTGRDKITYRMNRKNREDGEVRGADSDVR